MPDELPPPRLTLTDPGLGDVVGHDPERPRLRLRDHPRAVALLAAVALVVATTVLVLHRQEQDRQRELASVLGLKAEVVSAGYASNPQSGRRYGGRLELTEADHHPFVVVSASLGPVRLFLPTPFSATESASQPVEFELEGDCTAVTALPQALTLHVTAQRPDQRPRSLRVPLTGVDLLLAPARRDCGLLGIDQSLELDAGVPVVHGDTATVDVVLRNGSQDRGRLVGVSIGVGRLSAVVTTLPQLPLVLPPFVDGRPGAPVTVHLTLRFTRCPLVPGSGFDPSLTFTFVDDDGDRLTSFYSFGWEETVMPLAQRACH